MLKVKNFDTTMVSVRNARIFWLQNNTPKNYIVMQLSTELFRVKNMEDSWLLSTPMSLIRRLWKRKKRKLRENYL